ncbi:transglycosylase SLT domain protein [Aeromonas phage Aswh_1]|nr:transglycosylase SLT domain protein [Aeromonas phage Aswh_1]
MKSGLLFGILLSLTSLTANAVVYENKELTENQIYTIQRAYELGNESGYGLTLAAIALTESRAGVNLINKKSGDYGVFQNNLRSTTKRIEQLTGSKMSYRSRIKLRNELINSMESSANYALMELDYWKKVRGGNWRKVVESFNAGYGSNKTYVETVAQNVRFLRNCDCIK